MPERRTVAVAVLIIAGVALVLYLMSQNRAERAGPGGSSADGEAPAEGTHVTVAALNRLVADDRETATRWLGGKTVTVSGMVSLVARVPDGGGTVLVVGVSPMIGDSAHVFGFVAESKEAERLRLHEPV